jgi:hypothetical protein
LLAPAQKVVFLEQHIYNKRLAEEKPPTSSLQDAVMDAKANVGVLGELIQYGSVSWVNANQVSKKFRFLWRKRFFTAADIFQVNAAANTCDYISMFAEALSTRKYPASDIDISNLGIIK